MNYKLGENTTKNLESIRKAGNPKSEIIITAVKEFIKVTPIDFCIIDNGGFRTAKDQKKLFERGVSKCDGIKYVSKHQQGLAVDLVPWVNGERTWENKHAFYLAGAFMAFCNERGFDITSGADWNRDGNLKDGWDPCHMQLEE